MTSSELGPHQTRRSPMLVPSDRSAWARRFTLRFSSLNVVVDGRAALKPSTMPAGASPRASACRLSGLAAGLTRRRAAGPPEIGADALNASTAADDGVRS